MRRVLVLTIAALALVTGASPTSAAPLPSDAVITVRGHGWGHGRGMGQWGARGMAASGNNYSQILTHYYSGVSIGTRTANEDIRVLVESSPDVIVTSDATFSLWWSTGTQIAQSDATYKFWRVSWNGSGHLVEKSTGWKGPWTPVN